MTSVLFELDQGLLKVVLNRPSVLNAVNSDLLKALKDGLNRYSADTGVKALMLYGEGENFCSGADIGELSSLDENGIRKFHSLRESTFELLERFPVPTMAIIKKYALGTGLELALCCDFRIAAPSARLGIPSGRLGSVESYLYLIRLVRAVGPSQTRKMIFTAETVSAEKAFAIGLIEEVTPNEDVFGRAAAIWQKISSNSKYALRQSKKMVKHCQQDPYLVAVEDKALPMVQSLATDECREALVSFKRQTP